MVGPQVKISALDIEAIRFEHCVAWLRKRLPPIYVSGKWVNYMGVLMGMGFDWGYWFMTALCFRPCDYAQLWDSDSKNIYSLTKPKKVQERRAGHQAAKRCWWFTDSPLLGLADASFSSLNTTGLDDDAWFRATSPRLVLVETGSFSGTYTVDEADEYRRPRRTLPPRTTRRLGISTS